MTKSQYKEKKFGLTPGVMIIGCVVAAALFISGSEARAQEPPAAAAPAETTPSWADAIAVNGFVSAAYSYNFNSPDSRTNQLRVFDFDDNSIKLDVAELVLQRAAANPSDTGFRFDFTAGSSIPRIAASAGLFRDSSGNAEDFDLQQAYVSAIAPVGRGLRFDIGKFATHAGAEVIEGYDGWNDNYSRSFLFGYAQPGTHTGIKMSYPFSDKVAAMFMVANGWDNAKDNNRGKTIMAQLLVAPTPAFTLYTNYIGGPEQADSSNQRHLLDLVAVWKPMSRLALMLNYDYATEAGLLDRGDAKWNGVACYARYDINDKFSLALRGEWFDDEDGVRTGTAQTLQGCTISPTVTLSDKMLLRCDLRLDRSDEDVFEDGDSFSDTQTTLAFNAIYHF